MKGLPRFAVLLGTVLLVMLLVGPFLIPIPSLQDTVPAQHLADSDSRFVDVHGLDVHYKLVGEGQPVLLLLHGFGASLFSWREVMTPLAQFGAVVAFDRPAFGLTERPVPGEWAGESPYAADAQVRLTVGLLDKLGAQQAILVGNSAGGTIAVLTALRFPERVQALILVSPAIQGGGDGPSWTRSLLRLPQIQRLGPLLVRNLVPRLESALPTAWHDPSKISPEVVAGYKRPLRVDNWDRAFWEFVLAGRPLDLEEHLERIAMPTLVITGDDDTWVPTAQSVRLARKLPGAELAVIPNCGHVSHEECPEEFMQAVAPFVDGLR
jgi:pimeloyl-ACP methyl ester carboxylesterase